MAARLDWTKLLLVMAAIASREAVAQDVPRDPLGELQNDQVATKTEKRARPYHFGTQGPNGVFSNHTSHSNRLIPFYVFGRKADISEVTGVNSPYRDAEKIKAMYGRLPKFTLNPEADYADQSSLYVVQKHAVEKGAKYLFIVWFDGMDWPTTQAAAAARTGTWCAEGKGSGLAFLDETADGSAQYGYYVTSPTHADPGDELYDVDKQTVHDFQTLLKGGYDVRFGGPNPWTPGPLLAQAPGYIRGQSMTKAERKAVIDAGGVLHAYTDSAPSAAEFASGVKQFNSSINAAADGHMVPTLFNQLQDQGWKVGTVTSVPFSHASPAAMYAHNVQRDDYQDLSREMLGLDSIVQRTGKGPKLPGLDVVIGAGWGNAGKESDYKSQGADAVRDGNMFVSLADIERIDASKGGKYVVSQRQKGVDGNEGLLAAASQAKRDGKRLFGLYGMPVSSHLPFRTANGDYLPAKGVKGTAERYSPADLRENPSLVTMTKAALEVLSAEPGKPFALFVEAGDVDFALHDNNLDNAIGAVYDGEAAFQTIVEWIHAHSNWDESVVIAAADHGHYLVVDDPAAIAGKARDASNPAERPASGN